MVYRNQYSWAILVVSCFFALANSPARAQADPPDELDRLIAASAESAPGLALAREQASSGDLLAALATAERVLIANPEADDTRLYHAVLLCRLDDRRGARAELAEFAGRPVSDQAWAEVEAACGKLPRPETGGTEGAR